MQQNEKFNEEEELEKITNPIHSLYKQNFKTLLVLQDKQKSLLQLSKIKDNLETEYDINQHAYLLFFKKRIYLDQATMALCNQNSLQLRLIKQQYTSKKKLENLVKKLKLILNPKDEDGVKDNNENMNPNNILIAGNDNEKSILNLSSASESIQSSPLHQSSPLYYQSPSIYKNVQLTKDMFMPATKPFQFIINGDLNIRNFADTKKLEQVVYQQQQDMKRQQQQLKMLESALLDYIQKNENNKNKLQPTIQEQLMPYVNEFEQNGCNFNKLLQKYQQNNEKQTFVFLLTNKQFFIDYQEAMQLGTQQQQQLGDLNVNCSSNKNNRDQHDDDDDSLPKQNDEYIRQLLSQNDHLRRMLQAQINKQPQSENVPKSPIKSQCSPHRKPQSKSPIGRSQSPANKIAQLNDERKQNFEPEGLKFSFLQDK